MGGRTISHPILLVAMLAAFTMPHAVVAGDANFDATFATAGVFTTSLGPDFETPTAAAVQPDGAILVAGAFETGPYGKRGTVRRGFVLRLTPGGALDPTFGAGGAVSSGIGEHLGGIAMRPDGRIVVAGHDYGDVFVARLLVDGALDPSFGVGGAVRTRLERPARAQAVALQPDGKIVVAVTKDFPKGDACQVLRYQPDGSLDVSFGDAGIASAAAGEAYECDLVLAGGGIVVGSDDARSNRLVRFLPDGTLDATYGTRGAGQGAVPYVSKLATQSDGSVVVVGRGSLRGVGVTPDGSVAGAFALPTEPVYGRSPMVVDADDRIIVAGATDGQERPVFLDTQVWRLHSDGTPDTSFATGGRAVYTFGEPYRSATALAVQPDGKVIVAGFTGIGGELRTDLVIVRLGGGACGDGVLDPGEECDDGNALLGDCCQPGCAFDPVGAWCPEVDGDACTESACDGAGACTDGTVPQRCFRASSGSFRLRDQIDEDADQLRWKASGADPFSAQFFRFPNVSFAAEASYTMCLFGGTPAPALLRRMLLPGQPICGPGSCWTFRGGARLKWMYRDPLVLRDGFDQILLEETARGPKISVKGRGFRLDPPAAPLPFPLRVQLHSSQGACWETIHPTAIRNEPGRVEAR